MNSKNSVAVALKEREGNIVTWVSEAGSIYAKGEIFSAWTTNDTGTS